MGICLSLLFDTLTAWRMKNPREPFERLLDVFDDSFKSIAERRELAFDPRVGHVGRALRLTGDPMKRGIFLDLKTHWMQSDAIDPGVVLRYGAWSSSHILSKRFFDGKLSELRQCIDARLEQAVSELMMVSTEAIDREGKSLEDLRKGAIDL
jgi:hypothetical protein